MRRYSLGGKRQSRRKGKEERKRKRRGKGKKKRSVRGAETSLWKSCSSSAAELMNETTYSLNGKNIFFSPLLGAVNETLSYSSY